MSAPVASETRHPFSASRKISALGRRAEPGGGRFVLASRRRCADAAVGPSRPEPCVPCLTFGVCPGAGIVWRPAMRRRGRRSAARRRPPGAHWPSARCFLHHGCGGVPAMCAVPDVRERAARVRVNLAAGWQARGPGRGRAGVGQPAGSVREGDVERQRNGRRDVGGVIAADAAGCQAQVLGLGPGGPGACGERDRAARGRLRRAPGDRWRACRGTAAGRGPAAAHAAAGAAGVA